MKKSLFKFAAAFGFAAVAMNVHAGQDNGGKGMDMGGMKMDCMKNMENMKGMQMDCMGTNAAKATSMSDGEVKHVDKANKSITLKHGPIDNMHMGPMTMAFAVKDPALLSKVKTGDKVKFKVENVNGIATVTALTVQK
jgi:Cu(I)/Ag(I) efflux system protein CusF